MKDNYGWPTTRRFPNTMLEAFPDDVENAKWWFPPEQCWQDKVMFAIGVCCWIALGIFYWRYL